jgi:hypothetical protein
MIGLAHNRSNVELGASLRAATMLVTARADIEGIDTSRILAELLERIPAPR